MKKPNNTAKMPPLTSTALSSHSSLYWFTEISHSLFHWCSWAVYAKNNPTCNSTPFQFPSLSLWYALTWQNVYMRLHFCTFHIQPDCKPYRSRCRFFTCSHHSVYGFIFVCCGLYGQKRMKVFCLFSFLFGVRREFYTWGIWVKLSHVPSIGVRLDWTQSNTILFNRFQWLQTIV